MKPDIDLSQPGKSDTRGIITRLGLFRDRVISLAEGFEVQDSIVLDSFIKYINGTIEIEKDFMKRRDDKHEYTRRS